MPADSVVYLHVDYFSIRFAIKKCKSGIDCEVETAEDTADYHDLLYFTGRVQHHSTTVFQGPESAL